MRILVVGAHHGLGLEVVRQARAAGHRVTAFEGDVLDAVAVRAQVAGQEAVVSTLGPRKGAPVDLCATGTQHIVDAMTAAGVLRLVVVSGALIGHRHDRLGLLYRFIRSRLPRRLLEDRRKAERIVTKSALDWTLVRPTRLTDDRPKGHWREADDARVGAFAKISRADAAAAILQALGDPATVGRALTLQY